MENHTLKQRLRSAEGQTLLRRLISANPKLSRSGLAREICAELDWKDALGRPKAMGCRQALLRLEREGRVVLPAARRGRPGRPGRPARRVERAAAPTSVCPEVTGALEDLGAISLKPVKGGTEDSDTWNALMNAHHPLRSGPLCGAQIRYLIISQRHGALGGLAVSAPAWRLAARDAWLGWDDAGRLANLQGVVNNTRFLIAPTVRVKHLASHVLGQLAQRISEDWRERYGLSPWLMETFVDASHSGASYRAANWIEAGLTTGRGRQDSAHAREEAKRPHSQEPSRKKPIKDKTAKAREAAAEKQAQDQSAAAESEKDANKAQKKPKTPKPRTPGPRKRVFLYPLCRKTLQELCPRHGQPAPETKPYGEWLHREFGRARLGDRRLEKRLLEIAKDFSASPTASIPEACGGSPGKIDATYRFLRHERITMDSIIEPHRLATIDRMRSEPVALVAQDSSSLNYATHTTMEDIGPIGTKADGAHGLILHSAMVFRPDGLPLGILHADCIKREPDEHGKSRQRSLKPIEDKESYKWIEALAPIEQAARQCPDTRIVVTADREADIYEFFLEAEKKKLDLLVRAKEDRLVAEMEANRTCKPTPGEPPARLWRQMLRVAEAGQFELHIPARPGQPKRTAKMSVRHARITFQPPQDKPHLPLFKAWVVWADEISKPPKDAQRVEWMLITTVPVHSLDDALERIQWYSERWGIEVFHRTLKSGCRIEDRQLGTADRLETCLAIDMIVAWRIQHLTWLTRAEPDAPCTIVFEDDEWRAVTTLTTRRPAPDTPPTLREMTRTIAAMGGFISGKSRGEPGTQTLWRGLLRMDVATLAFKAYQVCYPNAVPPLSAQSQRRRSKTIRR